MKTKFTLIGFFTLVGIIAIAVSLSSAAINPALDFPVLNKITYGTNSIQFQDSTTKYKNTYNKGTIEIATRGTGVGSTVAFIIPDTKQVIWKGPVSAFRIVGVVATDSLKIISLESTPFK